MPPLDWFEVPLESEYLEKCSLDHSLSIPFVSEYLEKYSLDVVFLDDPEQQSEWNSADQIAHFEMGVNETIEFFSPAKSNFSASCTCIFQILAH